MLDSCSGIVILSSHTGKRLTDWIHVQVFSSVVLIFKHEETTHFLDAFSDILISDSDLLKHWRDSLSGSMFSHSHQGLWYTQTPERETHFLDACPAILVSDFVSAQTWEAHHLDVYSTILISSSYQLKHRRATHSLDGGVQPFSSVVLIPLNTVVGHTPWINVQPFVFIMVLICITLKKDSLSGCMSSQSYQWFWSAHTLESNSQPGCVFSHNHQWFNLLKHWRWTHNLDLISVF